MGLVNLNSPTSFYSFSDNPFFPSSQTFPLLEIRGSKGGWQGFYFPDFERHLLVNSQFQGAFNKATAAWIWRFNNGLLDIGSVPWARLTGIPVASASQAGLISEESAGTWTPALSVGSHTYGTREGRYIKIGNLVVADFGLTVSAKDSSLSSNIIISGLPFAREASSSYAIGNFWSANITFTKSAVLSLSGSLIRLFHQDGSAVTYSQAASAFQVYGAISYTAA